VRSGSRCARLVWRRDGIDCVLNILTHDLWLFFEIMPRVLGNAPARAPSSRKFLPHEKVARSLGPKLGAERDF